MATISFVRIPWDVSKPLETLELDLSTEEVGGDQLPKHLKKTIDPDQFVIETVPLKRMAPYDAFVRQYDSVMNLAGVYAYRYSSATGSERDRLEPNIRATCLSMACGLHSQRFHGDIFISRLGYFPARDENGYQLTNASLTSNEMEFACQTPDLRIAIINALNYDVSEEEISLPTWITEAAKCNYEDSAALAVLASVMQSDKKVVTDVVLDSVEEESDSESGSDSDADDNDGDTDNDKIQAKEKEGNTSGKTFVTKTPLCLQCRQPSANLCPCCNGMYFCESPRPCPELGWSHQAICKTWAVYTKRRDELGSFPFDGWHIPLLERRNQISEEPYKSYLMNNLGVLKSDDDVTWWATEINGWCGGGSDSAKKIDVIRRLSYQAGFALDPHLLPPERPVSSEDSIAAGISRESQCNLLDLNSWEDYYKLRGVPLDSPVALLLTFPLTIHYAFLKHGAVPITVANMLRRPVRVHVVGIEKELNFLDLFKELAFLLPDDLSVSIIRLKNCT